MSNTEWIEFKISPCKLCGKVPIINKDLTRKEDFKYILSHCNLNTNAHTETLCIVKWNELNRKENNKEDNKNESEVISNV